MFILLIIALILIALKPTRSNIVILGLLGGLGVMQAIGYAWN